MRHGTSTSDCSTPREDKASGTPCTRPALTRQVVTALVNTPEPAIPQERVITVIERAKRGKASTLPSFTFAKMVGYVPQPC